MGWMDKVKGLAEKGVQEAQNGLSGALQNAKDNAAQKAEELREEREATAALKQLFKPTDRDKHIEVDSVNRLFRLPATKEIHPFSDLAGYELMRDGDSVTSGGFGVGRALVGGAIAGPLGLLGGFTKKKKTQEYTNSMDIRVSVANSKQSTVYIPLIKGKTAHDSKEYKKAIREAQDTLSRLDIIASTSEKE